MATSTWPTCRWSARWSGRSWPATRSPAVAKEWVPRICSGEEIVGIGLTEPHAGSDAGMPRLTAVRDGDDWVLNGAKSLSFARDAAAVVVFARTGPSGEARARTSARSWCRWTCPG